MNNTLQANIDALIEHIDAAYKKNSVTNIQVAAVLDFLNRYCLREDKANTFQELNTFLKGFLVGENGSGITVLKDGTTQAVVDRLNVKLKATFESLEIKESTYIGGETILSHAGMRCIRVEETEDAWRCYFLAKQEGVSVKNYFSVGSQGYSKQGGLKSGDTVSSRYYWRLVTAIGDDYIDLSKTVCSEDSDRPQIGDAIAALGHQTDITLQGAIILSSVNDTAPSITLYAGINEFTLSDKEVIALGFHPDTGKAYLRVYGEAYIGARDKSSYIEYTIQNGLSIKGKFYNAAGDELGNLVDNLNLDVESIKKQTDKQYVLWFGTELPTLTNYPTVDWAETEYAMHEQDLFYLDNEADEENNGRAWRFMLQPDGVAYGWNEVTDKFVLQCLKTASDAKKEAQSKKRVFVLQPTDDQDYDVGDLWTNASYKAADGSYLYENETLVCKVSKSAGEPFSISHWKAASYATKANIINTGESIRLEVQANIDAVSESLSALEVSVGSINATVQQISFDASGNITNIDKSGLLLEADFASLFASSVDADGNIVKQAQISAFVTMDDVNGALSNIELSADQINFIGKTIINGNFTVDLDGNLTLNNMTAKNINAEGKINAGNGSSFGGIKLQNGIVYGVAGIQQRFLGFSDASTATGQGASAIPDAIRNGVQAYNYSYGIECANAARTTYLPQGGTIGSGTELVILNSMSGSWSAESYARYNLTVSRTADTSEIQSDIYYNGNKVDSLIVAPNKGVRIQCFSYNNPTTLVGPKSHTKYIASDY